MKKYLFFSLIIFCLTSSLFSQSSDSIPLRKNSIYSSMGIFIYSHLGYERKFNVPLSIGINLFRSHLNNAQYFDYKGEIFVRIYGEKRRNQFIQLKYILGQHRRTPDVGCIYKTYVENTQGFGINFGKRFYSGKSRLYFEPGFGIKYYSYPFDYSDELQHCSDDYKRIANGDRRRWLFLYPGALVELNMNIGIEL